MTTAEMDNLQTGERQREDEAGFGGGGSLMQHVFICRIVNSNKVKT